MEVKNVPLAVYKEGEKQVYSQIAGSGSGSGSESGSDDKQRKYAYFPDGYKKKEGAIVSERALKHVRELARIKKICPDVRCIMLYVIQRTDIEWFQPARTDPTYLQALRDAWWEDGVEIKTLVVEWKRKQDGEKEGREKWQCHLTTNSLPIMLYDDYNLVL